MSGEHDDEVERAAEAWVARCRALAEQRRELDGTETPAEELAQLAAGDRRVMERARRRILRELEHDPDDAVARQMQAFWRRAFERGQWAWDDTPSL